MRYTKKHRKNSKRGPKDLTKEANSEQEICDNKDL
jgi:hypothetical protein